MVDKHQAIERVHSVLGHKLLNNHNTRYSNINASKDVWWFHIPPNKFKSALHLLCVGGDSRLIWLKIEANTFLNPEKVFKLRPDNG